MSTDFSKPPHHPDHDRIMELAEARGYRTAWHRGDAPWLLWNAQVERVGVYPLEKLFEPFELFRHTPSDPYPNLQLYRSPTSEDIQRVQEAYQRIEDRVSKDSGGNNHRALPELNAVLSAIYETMDRIEPRLYQPFMGGRRVIEAWIVETERALLEDGKAKLLIERVGGEDGLAGLADDELTMAQRLSKKIRFERATRHGGAGELYDHARLIWGYLTRGDIDVEGLERLFERLCGEVHTPPLVATSQASGLRHYYGMIDPVLRETLDLDDKRRIYETIRHAILTDEQPPAPEKYANDQRDTWRDLPLKPASTEGYAHRHNAIILGIAFLAAKREMSPGNAMNAVFVWYEEVSKKGGGEKAKAAAERLAPEGLRGYARRVEEIMAGIGSVSEHDRQFVLTWAEKLGLTGTDRNESEENGGGG